MEGMCNLSTKQIVHVHVQCTCTCKITLALIIIVANDATFYTTQKSVL